MVKEAVLLVAVLAMSGLPGFPAAAAPAQPSVGCGTAPPARPPAAVRVGGRWRGVIVAVPDSYDPTRPHAVTVAFHGRTNSNAQVRRYFNLERNADGPTIFVYPAGRQGRDGRYTWADPGDRPGALRDFALFDAALDAVARRYCIDRGAVHVVGHSLGASFANSLACARGAVIRGVATVGGGIARPADCSGPVAAMVLHNPRDRLVPVSEGYRVRRSLLAQNGFDTGSVPAEPRRFNCRRYGPEDAANPVLWCPHADDRTRTGRFYPHQWPAGTGAAIMGFFAELG